MCGRARVHLQANQSAYVIGVDKLNVEGLSGLPWEQKKEVNSGSVGLSKRMSQHVLFLGSARGEGEEFFNALLSDEFLTCLK